MISNEELNEYIKLYHSTIYKLALSMVHNAAEAEDICQETFIKLMDYRGNFDGSENCKAWLVRVAINLSKNVLKSCRFTRIAELDENIPQTQVFSPDPSCNEAQSELWQAVAKLPPQYRSVIHLYYYEGYSVKEIAKIERTTSSNVTMRLTRARKKLKIMLLRGENQHEKRIQSVI